MDTHSYLMQMRTGLIILRSFQVVLAVAACITNLVMLGDNARMYDEAKNPTTPGSISELIYTKRYVFMTAFGTDSVPRDEVGDVESRVGGMLAGSIIEIAVNLLTLVLTIALLVLTTRPKSRARASCCGNRAACGHLHADMGIDIMFAVFYFILLILSLAFHSFMFSMVYTGFFVALFIVSAVLSGESRRLMHEAAEARGQNRPASIINQRMPYVDVLEPGQAKGVQYVPPNDEGGLEV